MYVYLCVKLFWVIIFIILRRGKNFYILFLWALLASKRWREKDKVERRLVCVLCMSMTMTLNVFTDYILCESVRFILLIAFDDWSFMGFWLEWQNFVSIAIISICKALDYRSKTVNGICVLAHFFFIFCFCFSSSFFIWMILFASEREWVCDYIV